MITVRLLGPVEIEDAGGRPLEALLRRPKRVVLLAYLCAATPNGYHRRDKLIGLFWPEMTQDQARHALSQSLHVLRQELGEKTILARGDGDVGVDCDLVSCDVLDLQRAIEEGRNDAALELYRGDLLEGYFISDAPEFDRWLDEERTRLREQAAGVAWALAREHIANNRLVDAERTAQRALLLVPTDESEVRGFIEALADAGDRAAAIRFYEKFAARLREEYEIEPGPETKQLVGVVRSTVEPVTTDVDAGASLVSNAAPQGGRRVGQAAPRRRARVLAGGGVAIAVALLVYALATWPPWIRRPSAGSPDINPNLVLVGPFRVTTSDPQLVYLRNGMVDMLHARFTGEGLPNAVDPTWAIRNWETGDEGSAGMTAASAVGLARQMGAGQLVMGWIVGTASALELTAQMLSVPGGELISSVTVRGSEGDLVGGLVDSLVLQLVGKQIQREGLGLTNSLAAMRAYLTAREAQRRGSLVEALQAYDRALEIDSSFRMASYGMWQSCAPFGFPSPFQCNQWEHYRFRPSTLPLRERTIMQARINSPAIQRLRTADEGARLYPGNADALWLQARNWFKYGAVRHHDSVILPRAVRAIDQALELDPANLSYLHTAIQIGAAAGDAQWPAGVRDIYLEHSDSTDLLRPYVLWLAANGLGDSNAMREVLDLLRVTKESTDEGRVRPVIWQVRYATAYYGFPHDAMKIMGGGVLGAITEGRASDLARMMKEYPLEADELCPGCDIREAWQFIALGPTTVGRGFEEARRIALDRLSPYVELLETEPGRPRRAMHYAPCWYQFWRLHRGEDVAGAHNVLSAAERAGASDNRFCLLLAAALESLENPDGPAPQFERLDSLLSEGGGCGVEDLMLADMWASRGDSSRSLQALQRRRVRRNVVCGPAYYMAEFLVREGRLAAALGDTVAAIVAYDRYLKLRTDPDPGALTEERNEVRRHLAQLVRDRGR
jgi:serine/threonine-protein kinase